MQKTIKNIFQQEKAIKNIQIFGWIKQFRAQKNIAFLEINDGTCLNNLHLICKNENLILELKKKINIGASLKVQGDIVLSQNREQKLELIITNFKVLGKSDENFPLQKKEHSLSFLREIVSFRSRTKLFAAIFKIRSLTSFAIHSFFQKNNFFYVNTPIITTSDAEGAGEIFQIIEPAKKTDNFFNQKAFLTVSGQLEEEALISGLGKVYNFSPVFRAEKSHTPKHLSEFWMIEAEIAFFNLSKIIQFTKKFIKNIFQYVLKNASSELTFLSQKNNIDLQTKIKKIINNKIPVITFKKAITILKKEKKIIFNFTPSFEEDLASEHEKYLTNYFEGPVFITNWPKKIKAFYMKLNQNNQTVAAFDLLFPEIGELIGGSEREDDFNKLNQRMIELNLKTADLDWFLNIRKYGSCFHSGFGLGLDRLIMFLTGMSNIRDVIPFPRTPKKIL